MPPKKRAPSKRAAKSAPVKRAPAAKAPPRVYTPAETRTYGRILIYEDRDGAVCIRHGDLGGVWSLGAVTTQMRGTAWLTALGWCRGDWEPDEAAGCARLCADGTTGVELGNVLNGLRMIAEWTPTGRLRVERDARGRALVGAAGRAYLGIGEDYDRPYR